MNESGHFSLSVRLAEGEALVTVVEEGARVSNELVRHAVEQALARRSAERAYTMQIALAEPKPSMPPLTYGSSRRRRILVVDDNVDAAQSLALLLRQLGHDVQVAHDGHAALEAARVNRPQLLLLDLSMPGVDGYRVVERLKSDASFARVSFVAVTGSNDHDARRRSEEAGFAEHLVKPVELATLRKVLERL